MAVEKKIYSRYIFNRGLETLWLGEPSQQGSRHRSIALTSPEFNSTAGVFQVFALEGVGKGIEDGKFAGVEGQPEVLFDADFSSIAEASKQFNFLIKSAQDEGFEPFSIWDQIEFEEKARASQAKKQ